MLVNSARGESNLLINGIPHRLCLTLGALAQIETGLGLSAEDSLPDRLSNISANDVLLILQALLAGGGNPVSVEAMSDSSLMPNEVATAIAEAFSLAGAEL